MALLALAQQPTIVAQQAEQRSDVTLSERVEVSIVNLDVYVTDKKGRPITGLAREDFRVLEDRKEVEVTNFLAVETPAPGEKASASGQVEPLHLIIYVDNALMQPNERQRVLGDVREFMTRDFPPGTRFTLASRGSTLKVVVPYASEAEEVLSALQTHEWDSSGVAWLADRSRAVSRIETIYDACKTMTACEPCEDRWEEMLRAARNYAVDANRTTGNAMDGLFRFIVTAGSLPGRKALLYLASGLERRPGEDIYYLLTDGKFCPDRASAINAFVGEFDYTTALYQLTASANANRITFYTIDAAGVRNNDGGTGANAATANARAPLYLLGSETGGEAIFNSARPLPRLEAMAQDLTNYYSIAYRPLDRREQRGTSQNHLIDVELPGEKKATVRFRRSMRAKPLQERLAERLMATLLLGAEDNPLNASMSVDSPILAAKNRYEVPVRVTIPRAQLLRISKGNTVNSELRIFMVARNAQNEGTGVREKVWQLEDGAAGSTASDKELEFVVTLELKPGEYHVAVGIRDEVANTASYLRQPVSLIKP